MQILDFLLFLGAVICFAIAAFSGRLNAAAWWGNSLVPLGLFLWALDLFIHVAQNMHG